MNSFGHIFRLQIFGESHSATLGIILDGVPAGIALSESDFVEDLSSRKAGEKGTTPRREKDLPMIQSGVYQGFTTGAPLCLQFQNNNTRSQDYEDLKSCPRPGHADYAAFVKFGGYNDPRGGGMFSGRLSLLLVAAGVVAKKILAKNAVEMAGENAGENTEKSAHDNAIQNAEETANDNAIQNVERMIPKAQIIELGGCSDPNVWDTLIQSALAEKDSLGAIIECRMKCPPIAMGEPFFDSAESLISHLIFAIPGVRGLEFGDGFSSSKQKGSEHNDLWGRNFQSLTNHAGGINGGITNGSEIVFRVAFKPTSSIGKVQHTWDRVQQQSRDLEIKGRHDACFALRCPVIVEAALSIVLADLFLLQKAR